MRLITSGTVICVAMVLLAGCKQPAAEAGLAAAGADAHVAADEAVAGATDQSSDAAPGKINESDAISVAAAMTAAVELCGVSNAAESRAALAKMKAEAESTSAARIDAVYASAMAQGKIQSAKDPAAFERSCAGMHKMADPAELKKMQEAAEKLEKFAAEMEAKAAK